MICETCSENITRSELYYEYEDVIECEDCHNYFRYEIGKTG